MKKCNMKDCLCYEKKTKTCWDMVMSTRTKQQKPNSKKCPFYSNDLKKDYEEIKKQGGLLAVMIKTKKDK